MDRTEFDKIVENTLTIARESLIIKGKEYDREGNPFHNFDKGAKRKDKLRERVIEDYSLKHEVSIDDMICDIEKGELPSYEIVEEKFKDAINYLILKKASIVERINNKPKPF